MGIKLAPHSAVAHVARALVENYNRKLQEAVDDYSVALNIEPHCMEALIERGLLYHEMALYFKALDDYDSALSINPKYAEAYLCRAWVFYRLWQFDTARLEVEKCLALDPKCAPAHCCLGMIEARLGQPQKAIEQFTIATQYKPDYFNPVLARASTFNDLGQYQLALNDANQVFEQKLLPARTLNCRAVAYCGLGKYDLAEKDAQTLLQRHGGERATERSNSRQHCRPQAWRRAICAIGFQLQSQVKGEREAVVAPDGTRTLPIRQAEPTAETNFNKFAANYALRKGVITMTEGIAKGPSTGATASGQIDLNDQKMQIKGTFIPLYGLNNLVSRIPLLGESPAPDATKVSSA